MEPVCKPAWRELDLVLGSRKLCVRIWPGELWAGSTKAGHVSGEPRAVCAVDILFQSWFQPLVLLLSLGRNRTIKGHVLPLNKQLSAMCFVCTEYSDVWLSAVGNRRRAAITSAAFLPLLMCSEADEIIYRTLECFGNNYQAKFLVLRVGVVLSLWSCGFGNTYVQNNCTIELLIFNFHVLFLTSLHGVL